MNKLIKYIKQKIAAWHINWLRKNYPLEMLDQVNHFTTIHIKKGKIREWRTYDSNGNRLDKVKM